MSSLLRLQSLIIPGLAFLALALTACSAPAAPPTDTRQPAYTPLPTQTLLPSTTPYPTATPYPTNTLFPTWTPAPTATPYPTLSPYPTYTPYPTATPRPTDTPTATPYPTPTPRPTPTSYPTATPTPEPTATPRTTDTPYPTATPSLTPGEQLAGWRTHLLGLVNGSRQKAGLPAVALGDNESVQQHAEAMLEHGFTGHWGLDGLTPAMRYTIAGGTGYVSENASGVMGIKDADWGPQYQRRGWRESLDVVHEGLLASPGHRKTVLDKWHRKVSLGIACNAYTCSVVQGFEGGYVAFTSPPRISRAGVLTFAGRLEGGFTMSSVQVWYHQPPHALTLGQLDAAYTSSLGQEPATFVIKPAPPGTYYPASDLLPWGYTWLSGVDPYSVSPKAPRDSRSALGLPRRILPLTSRFKAVPWTVASRWSAGASFEVKADMRKIVSDMGPGVYVAVIWGTNSREEVPLTNYAIFVD